MFVRVLGFLLRRTLGVFEQVLLDHLELRDFGFFRAPEGDERRLVIGCGVELLGDFVKGRMIVKNRVC